MLHATPFHAGERGSRGSYPPELLSKPGCNLAPWARGGESLPMLAELWQPCYDATARAAAEQPATAPPWMPWSSRSPGT